MQKPIVLDYSIGEVHVFNYNDEKYEEVEDYLSELENDALISRVCDLNLDGFRRIKFKNTLINDNNNKYNNCSSYCCYWNVLDIK